MKTRKFRKTRPPIDWVEGVCSGLGYYIGCPVWIIRVLFVLITLFTPWPIGSMLILAYILLAIFLPVWPENPKDFYKVTGD